MAPLNTLSLLILLPLATANTVQFDISRSSSAQIAQLQQREASLRGRALNKRGLFERADTVTADLTNARTQGLYFANVTVGTPAQALALQIDTGSSDVWVPAAEAALCSDVRQGGCPNGQFNFEKSSTFLDVGQNEFNISYVDGTGAAGDYFQDTFTIGGGTLQQFQMGIALDTTIDTGIMGIGYNTSEANVDTGNGTIYPNLPLAMVNQGLIKSSAYSLWLNDLQSSTGSILFGGVDTAKYTGDLISIDVYPSSRSGRVTSFTVAFTSLSATSPSGTDQLTPDDYAVAAILDSGTTITLLPDDVAAMVFEELGATVSNQLGAIIVPCDLAKVDGTLNYGFGGQGGPVIKVQVSDLVLPLTLTSGRTPKYTNGQEACQLGIQPAGDLPVLFGDTFLRSAYAVYDLENNKIALAQTDFNSTDSKVVSFGSSGAAIPNAVSASGIAAVTQTATGAPRVSGGAATGTGAAAPTYNPTATGLNAASGFAATGTGSSGSSNTKKSAAGAGPEPFAWSRVVIGVVSLGMMGVGTGVFALL
ncbi:aspartic peptidase domain-containing protein [Rhexocercosporidium sp. MPI-PUGE-AT-0058]|nr:aspartic peptidase domain-containing protein [Rhexocercosporidium sp. MPI-PUGE-AT-0058]